MPLQKNPVDISFAQGLDLKSDPKRVPIGKFLNLENSIFTKAGLLQKRNGFPALTTLPVTDTQFLTTFNDDLTAIGSNIEAYDLPNKTWIDKATLFPCELSTLPLIRSNTNQSQADSVIAENGLICTVFTDQNLTSLTTNIYKYVIADSVTGQNIIEPTQLTEADSVYGTPKVYLLQNYFVILYTQNVTGNYHLRFLAISVNIPTITIGPSDVKTGVTPNNPLSFDAYTVETKLFIAYSEASGGQALNVTYITNVAAGPVTSVSFTGYYPSPISVTSDGTYVYVSWSDTNSSLTYALAVDLNLNTVLSPLETSSSVYPAITSTALNGTLSQFFENTNDYPDNVTPTHFISKISITLSPLFHSVFSSGASTITVSSANGLSDGMTLIDNSTPGNITTGTTFTFSGTTLTLSQVTAGNSASSPGDALIAVTFTSITVLKRSLGLASKAFLYKGVSYILTAYASTYQPTFFLMDGSGDIIAKLAYSNAGSLILNGSAYLFTLPNITLTANVVNIPYLIKDSITAVNKTTALNATNDVAGIYAQSGINLVTIEIGTSSVSSSEAANTLNLSGGFVWSYDGYVAVEQNFFTWPDYVTATWTEDSIVTPTGTVTSGSAIVTAISSLSGVAAGMTITDSSHAYIPAGTTIIDILSSTSLLMSAKATNSSSGNTLSIQGNISAESESENTNAYYYQVIYSWSDNQGNRNVSAPSIPIAVTTTDSASRGTITLTINTQRLTYKIANPIKIEIYRWSIAQPVYYQVTSIQLPLLNPDILTTDTVTFIDPYPDSAILGNEIIYTTGGVIEDISPPATSLMTLFQTRLWLVDAEDPNLLWFSKQIIEDTPIEMSDLFTLYVSPTISAQGSTGPITAIAPMDDKLIIFKRSNSGTAIYYINGTGPDNTGANSQFSEPTFITSTIGCDNQQSIVFIPLGLMFQSDKGIWLLGRDLSTQYIGAPVETLTEGALVETALTVPGTTQVRFTMNTGVTLMYDYFYNAWGVFNLNGISSTLFQGMHTYVNGLGQVFQESPGTYLDGTSPVLMSFTTAWISLAGLQGFERFYQCYLLGEYITPFKLNVQFAYDYNPSIVQSEIVIPQSFQPNWGNDPLWGSDPVWGGISKVFGERVFPDKQKCETFQLTINEIYDASYGVQAGAGLTLSGLNLIVGVKRGFRTQSAGKSA